jgi:hypothetical protein
MITPGPHKAEAIGYQHLMAMDSLLFPNLEKGHIRNDAAVSLRIKGDGFISRWPSGTRLPRQSLWTGSDRAANPTFMIATSGQEAAV